MINKKFRDTLYVPAEKMKKMLEDLKREYYYEFSLADCFEVDYIARQKDFAIYTFNSKFRQKSK